MAWAVDPGRAFLRDPDASFKHDAFGHDSGADFGIRSACFRAVPHSGLDFTGRGPIYSIAGGRVVAAGWSSLAGWYVIEEVTVPGFGTVFPVYFHAAAAITVEGVTKAGQRLGEIGDTGSGTSKGAFHLHLSVATSLDAAKALVMKGNSARRKNETVAQWASRMGLIDPLPIVRAVRDGVKDSAPANPATQPTFTEEDDMARPYKNQGAIFTIGQQFIRHETDEKYAKATSKALTGAETIPDLTDEEFRSLIASQGIPASAPKRLSRVEAPVTQRGMAWSAAKDYHDPTKW